MRTRPWPIVILAILYFFAPFPNFLISAHLSGVGLRAYFHGFQNWWDLLSSLLLFPLAGIAIFKVRRWSYPVFVGVMAWGFWVSAESFMHYRQIFPIFLFTLVYLVNLAVVGYFLIPAVREVYFNARLRWWESHPRYEVDASATLRVDGKEIQGKIRNISVGGIFLEANQSLEVPKDVEVKFDVHRYSFDLSGKLLYINPQMSQGYGVQFTDLKFSQKRDLKRMVKELDKAGVRRRPEVQDWKENFQAWAKQAFTSGKGIVPEIPENLRRKKG